MVMPNLIARILVFREDNGELIDEGSTVWAQDALSPVPLVQVQFTIFNRGDRANNFWIKMRIRAVQPDRLVLDPRAEQVSVDMGRPYIRPHRLDTPNFYVAELFVDLTEQIHETVETDNTM